MKWAVMDLCINDLRNALKLKIATSKEHLEPRFAFVAFSPKYYRISLTGPDKIGITFHFERSVDKESPAYLF